MNQANAKLIIFTISNEANAVIIGDKALRYYLEGKPHIDLAKEWNRRFDTPFVFALLCYHKDKKNYQKIQKEFLKKSIKIPHYILEHASRKTDIDKREILRYLTYISYHLDTKAKLGLKKFYKKVIF